MRANLNRLAARLIKLQCGRKQRDLGTPPPGSGLVFTPHRQQPDLDLLGQNYSLLLNSRLRRSCARAPSSGVTHVLQVLN